MRSEEEVDQMIEQMISRSKGRYITQGVSFNKTCPRQMDLLKKSLMASVSFSGLVKEMLALRFDTPTVSFGSLGSSQGKGNQSEYTQQATKVKNVGNFI